LSGMIRRRNESGLLLIRQVEHARLSAELAAAVGNDRFATVLPRDQVLQAVELHDAGWPLHDDAPTVTPRGEPTDAFEMPLETALRIWSASTEIARDADAYAGLLVSLHGIALSQHVRPASGHSQKENFALIKFQHAQIEIQESLRVQLAMRVDMPLRHGLAEAGGKADEDLLLRNFRLLEFADQLSLNLCFDQCRFADVTLIPQHGASVVHLTLWRRDTGNFVLDPWPFHGQELQLTVAALPLPDRKFANDQDLRRACAGAQEQTLPITLRRGR
jgi:hypothetical protein